MSEVKNSTTDIDNNVQATPTPSKKRMSRAEKARIESEELLKSFGVTMEAGRQTRSSRRGPVIESPKPEPMKRKQNNTPRGAKKSKVVEVDQTDSTNHSDEGNENEAQIAEAPVANVAEAEKADEIVVAVTETESNNVECVEKMDVDTTVENTTFEQTAQPKSDSDEESQPAVNQIENTPPVEPAEVLENEGVSAAVADTTTTIVIDSEPVITEPSDENKSEAEPIEVQSSPIEIDSKDESPSNSQAATKPEAIVELESSSSEADDTKVSHSVDLEIINSDSSLSENEPKSNDNAAEEQSLPTSTAQVTITEIIDDVPAEKTNEIADSSIEPVKNSVDANQKPIEIPTITVDNPIDETITTTSETLLEPSATIA